MAERVLIAGLVTTTEMRPVVSDALSVFAGADVRVVPRVSAIPQEDNWSPDVVIVCQNRPDEFSTTDVHEMFARFPRARWVCCFGLWCESDGRNRDAWPISVRVPARLARSRFERERDVLNGDRDALPLTAGREEAFEFDYGTVGVQPSGCPDGHATCVERPTGRLKPVHQLGVTVVSPDRELRLSFVGRLRAAGFVMDDAAEDADVILWDADPPSVENAAELRRVREAHPTAGIIALLGLETPGDERAVLAAGADAVMGKLADGDRLAATVSQVLRK